MRHLEGRALQDPEHAVLVGVVDLLGFDDLAGQGAVERVLGVLEGPTVGVEGLALLLPGLGDALDWLGLPAAEGGQECLVGVQDATALLDDRDPVVEVCHHQVELLGPDGQHRLGLLELADGARAPVDG